MNAKRRKELRIAKKYIEDALEIISLVKDDEEDTLANMEEHFENNPKCDKHVEIIDLLEEAEDQANVVIDTIDAICST